MLLRLALIDMSDFSFCLLLIVFDPIFKLLGFTVVPVLHRAVIAGDATIDLGHMTAGGATEMLTDKIAVVGADGVSGRLGVIGLVIIF